MKDHFKAYINEYVNGDPRRWPDFSDMTQDIREYVAEKDATIAGHKAHRIYVKALVRKKVALALRIKDKYGDLFPKPGDTSMAPGFALMAVSKRN